MGLEVKYIPDCTSPGLLVLVVVVALVEVISKLKSMLNQLFVG